MILYCDGGMNKHTGDEAWGSVLSEEGKDMVREHKELFHNLNLKTVILPTNSSGIKGERVVIVSKFDGVKQQNNGAELLAFVASLQIAMRHSGSEYLTEVKEIRSDSELIVKWWSQGKVNPKILKTDPLKYKYIQESVILRKQFEIDGGKVVKINGDCNKADLGYH